MYQQETVHAVAHERQWRLAAVTAVSVADPLQLPIDKGLGRSPHARLAAVLTSLTFCLFGFIIVTT